MFFQFDFCFYQFNSENRRNKYKNCNINHEYFNYRIQCLDFTFTLAQLQWKQLENTCLENNEQSKTCNAIIDTIYK